MSSKRSKRRKEAKSKEVKKDLTPQFVNCDLADNKYSGIIREDHLGSQFLEGLSSTYIWSTGTKYEGPFIASQIEGRGKFTWPDGSKYEGELLGGRRNGDGAYEALDGKTRYDGQWLDGKRHGQGKLTYNSDTTSYYDGGWQAGQKHGYGKQLWPSGNCYEGEWKLGKMSGHGTMIWRNGTSAEVYTGAWVDNCPHGEGTHTWLTMDPSTDAATTESWLNRPASPPSAQVTGSPGFNSQQELRRHEAQIHATQQLNNRYTGQWVWGRREGTGTFYYANGAYYHGEWKGNVKEGHGRHTFDDGKVYDGKFEADRMVDYSRPEPSAKSLDDNPICGCTDISDMEVILRPSDKAGFTQTPGSGYSDPVKILKGIYNVLLRNLGDLREGYSRSRSVQPQLGEDPHVMTLVQFWSLARDSGILTPQSSIARFDRAIFSGPRHQSEMAPEDEQEIAELLEPSEKMATISLPRTGSSSSSKTLEADEESTRQESKEQDFWDEATEALYDIFEAGGASGSTLGRKFLRSDESDGNLVHIHAPARPLLFRQFLESFVRMAPMRFPKEQGLEQQVQRLFKEQVAPCLKMVSGSKSEGGGLISMLANFRRPASSAFGLFTQPEVREVVYELEPMLWKIFVELSGDAFATEAAKSIGGGGIFSGAGGLGANPSNAKAPEAAKHPTSQTTGPSEAESGWACHCQARLRSWGSPLRELHVRARLTVSLRVKDVLRFLHALGFLQNTLIKEQHRPLTEVLSGSEGDAVNNLLNPLGSGLSQEEPPEEENPSEDDEGSGGSAAPEEDEDVGSKQLPGLSISFMPKGSLLGGSAKDEKKRKDKEKKDKKEEKEVRTPAEDLGCINLMVDVVEVLRILAQVFSPPVMETLHWELDNLKEASGLDENVSILEFMETEVTFAEFMRLLFLMAEFTTRRDYKFCRSVSLTTRLDVFLKNVITFCQKGGKYVPPDTSASAAGESRKSVASRPEAKAEEAPAPATSEEQWLGFDDEGESCALRRWPEGYENEVADWPVQGLSDLGILGCNSPALLFSEGSDLAAMCVMRARSQRCRQQVSGFVDIALGARMPSCSAACLASERHPGASAADDQRKIIGELEDHLEKPGDTSGGSRNFVTVRQWKDLQSCTQSLRKAGHLCVCLRSDPVLSAEGQPQTEASLASLKALSALCRRKPPPKLAVLFGASGVEEDDLHKEYDMQVSLPQRGFACGRSLNVAVAMVLVHLRSAGLLSGHSLSPGQRDVQGTR
eukprot:s5214_g1.t1